MAHTGFSYFPIALLSRLPYAMMVVGVLTLVVAARGSMQLGGFNSAMVGVGAAIFGPLIGAAADRFGQRSTLLITAIINSAGLAVFAWVAFSSLPDWVMLANAFVIGASAPQTSPMSRSRLVTIIVDKLPRMRRDRTLNTAMAYESTADEIVFVFGPLIVGALATTLGAAAPVIGASLFTLFFVGAFALHRTSNAAPTGEERAATLEPAAMLVKPLLLILVAGIFAVGMVFGTVLTSLTAYTQSQGQEEQAGLLYGFLGIGSAVLALAVVIFPSGFTKRSRWVVFAVILVIGAVMLQYVDSVFGILVALVVIGIGIGPVLVTLFNLAADRSPVGRGATVMTMIGSGLIVGQSFATALTGWVSETHGPDAGFLMPVVATSLALITAIVNWLMSPPEKKAAQAITAPIQIP